MTSKSLQDLPFHTALLTITHMHIMYVSYVMESHAAGRRAKRAHLLVMYNYTVELFLSNT